MSSCIQTVSLGAYVLGALEPAERAAFEAHLAGCPACQAELVRLAPLPGLLHQITPEDFIDDPEQTWTTTPDGDPIEPPLPAMPSPRRRRYWLVAAAAVLALLIGVAGVLGYQAMTRPAAQAVQSVTWSAQDPSSGMHADAQLINHAWGTEVRLRLDESPSGKPCKLVVRDRSGGREVAGWWSSGYDTKDIIPGSTSLVISDISRLQIVTDDDLVLVDIPAPGQ
jgi:hypothetical protein